jgi:hypothetical protein
LLHSLGATLSVKIELTTHERSDRRFAAVVETKADNVPVRSGKLQDDTAPRSEAATRM